MFKVYDRVWIMYNNQPREFKVFAVVESMDFYKTGTETFYRLVSETCGAGWGNNEGIKVSNEDVFRTKEDLLKSL
jgi:hypothetical protein